MSLNGMVLGVVAFIFCIFLSLAAPSYFTNLPAGYVDVLQIGILFMGLVSIFIGATSK